jgi:PIN domain nuclease of toxin-antitoxin system
LRLLLDTHALLWWLAGNRALSGRAIEAIDAAENQVFVSAVSAFEVATKFRLGKLPEGELLARDFEVVVEAQGFDPLPLDAAHGRVAGALAPIHKDPFDRLLIAQALREDLFLVSNEVLFDGYGVRRFW